MSAPGPPPDDNAEDAQRRWIESLRPAQGKPYRDYVPPGEFIRLLPLVQDIDLHWPWPYTDAELRIALDALPEGSRVLAARELVHLARVTLGKLWARVREPRTKPNPIAELHRLKKAAESLMEALNGLSEDAELHLSSVDRIGYRASACDPITLKAELNRFLHLHRSLRNLPPVRKTDRRGRPERKLEQSFVGELRGIFMRAHSGNPDGFPAFRLGATEPLTEFGLLDLEPKTWEAIESSSKSPRLGKQPKQDV